MIRTLPAGEQITEPGAYRTPLEHYHTQDICPGPSVSSTGIRKLALQSPRAFFKTWDGNPDRYPDRDVSDALILGRAAHALILGDEVFDEHFAYVPDEAPRRPTATQVKAYERDGKWSDAAKEGAEWWEKFDAKAQGRTLITAEQVQRIMWMAESLRDNPLAVEVLTSELIEISMVWQDEITGIWLKSRPDCLPSNNYDFGDLKTFSPKGADLVLSAHRAVTDHGYAIQMALAIMGAEHVLGTTAQTCALVFVQTTAPFETIVIEIDSEAIYWAKVLIRSALDKMAHGLRTGDWPGVARDVVTYGFPPSMLHRFGDLQLNGELPNLERI